MSRYNPENIKTLEHYVELQAREKGYDLEANLALLKLYQFNPTFYRYGILLQVISTIL
jgi:translation initiation factor 3 subunit K